MKRRQFLRGVAATTGTVAIGRIARMSASTATAATLAVPTVDRLVVTSVVDDVYDPLARAGRLGAITVERTPRTARGEVPLVTEPGLALHLDSLRGIDRREILFDFAQTARALFDNYRGLGVDWTHADALVLSDAGAGHDGGLTALARAGRGKFSIGVTLYAGGDETFCHRVATRADGVVDRGQLARAELERTGLRVQVATRPTVLVDHAVTSGRIDRVTDFEHPSPTARLIVGRVGSPCAASRLGAGGSAPGDLLADTFGGEHAVGYHVKDRGLVVIVGCARAGVVNSVRQVQRVTGIDRIHAIAGGFHLADATDDVVRKTIDALRVLAPDVVVPMHCTGPSAIAAIAGALPGAVVMPSTGTRVTFGT